MRCLFCFLFCLVVPVAALAERQRVFVLTDISNEPDDEESLVRFLVYANEYDVEGLVATTSTWLKKQDARGPHSPAYRGLRTGSG